MEEKGEGKEEGGSRREGGLKNGRKGRHLLSLDVDSFESLGLPTFMKCHVDPLVLDRHMKRKYTHVCVHVHVR